MSRWFKKLNETRFIFVFFLFFVFYVALSCQVLQEQLGRIKILKEETKLQDEKLLSIGTAT